MAEVGLRAADLSGLLTRRLLSPRRADEVNALVLDIGSGTVKAGYAGEDTPKAYFPSVSCQCPDCTALLPPSCTARAQAAPCTQSVGVTGGDASLSDADGSKRLNAAQNGTPKRQLHVGQQALDYRRDHMQVCPPWPAHHSLQRWQHSGPWAMARLGAGLRHGLGLWRTGPGSKGWRCLKNTACHLRQPARRSGLASAAFVLQLPPSTDHRCGGTPYQAALLAGLSSCSASLHTQSCPCQSRG